MDTSSARLLALFAVATCLLWNKASCFTSSGVTRAFATFYGGSDASGTMGTEMLLISSFITNTSFHHG
jgi:hypothetical protein